MIRAAEILVAVLFFGIPAYAQKSNAAPTYNIPDLNKRAILLVTPSIDGAIIFDELDGKTISVKVVVDESGNAESARAPAQFAAEVRAAAERAALESKFEPLVVKGKAERYLGSLQYSFAYEKMDWFAFGTALESVHNYDNLSVTPVAEKLTVRWAEEKSMLAEIDKLTDVNERIKAIAGMIGHFRSRLDGKDRWLFSAAVAVRNATMWGMVGGRIDRTELQNALAKIAAVTENVPPEIPNEFVENLRSISAYKVDPEMTEDDLRRAIFDLQMKLVNYPR